MNLSQSMPLEHILTIHGDQLFRVALVLTGDEQQAAQVLRSVIRAIPAPQTLVDLSHLLNMLLAEIRQCEQQVSRPALLHWTNRFKPSRRRKSRVWGDFERVVFHLPWQQRQALVLHLFLGYDAALIAQINATSVDTERKNLSDALVSLAAPVGVPLPDAQPTEQCPPIRQDLMDPPELGRRDTVVRGHLAACGACRAFDKAWSALSQCVEARLRGSLRDCTLPADLQERLLRDIHIAPNWYAHPNLRFALLPLLVLALIGVVVLPGFFQRPAEQMIADAPPLDNPRNLIEQALDQIGKPPEGAGVWHAQWEAVWYFDIDKYAPLHASAWFDTNNPARHRLQLVHTSGGAPYELQIGDGREQFWYALDPLYHSSLYGSSEQVKTPQLLYQEMTATDQDSARLARLHAGAWNLGPAYLRQARDADDLSSLGRQRDGDHTVQILSFTGISPLALPSGAPGATEDAVTILLMLDAVDGRLRSATELVGPPNGAQTSRTTWRLLSEEWVTDRNQIRSAFDAKRAWTGKGNFARKPQEQASVDSAFLLVDQATLLGPMQLLVYFPSPLFLPAAPPADTERALFYRWDEYTHPFDSTLSLTYLGTEKWLTLSQDHYLSLNDAETLEIGPWTVSLLPFRGQRYQIGLRYYGDGRVITNGRSTGNINIRLAIDAQGYTRAELLQFIEQLQPADFHSVRSHLALFPPAEGVPHEVHTALVEALTQAPLPKAGEALYQRSRSYSRQNPAPDRLADPYHRLPYNGQPETVFNEKWMRPDSPQSRFATVRRERDADGAILFKDYDGEPQSWRYWTTLDTLNISYGWRIADGYMSDGDQIAFGMLGEAYAELLLSTRPDGTQVITRSENGRSSKRFGHLYTSDSSEFGLYLRDIQPMTITTELVLQADDSRPVQLRVYGEGMNQGSGPQRVLLRKWELLETAYLDANDVPSEIFDPTPPDALFVNDYTRPRVTASASAGKTISLDEARTRAKSPLFLLPTDGLLVLHSIRASDGDPSTPSFNSTPNLFNEAVLKDVAICFDYRIPDDHLNANRLTIYQGPVEPLRTFFRGQDFTPWASSEQRQATIAGREMEVWWMRGLSGRRVWLFAELEGTLLIATGPSEWFAENAVPLLAQLQLAE
ncbi:MAG: hypothetical protein MI924_08735 [Chloroflexales bacterium]|nr:hypothetical protein [Chloroflexales bacterium]